jgi:hypothetical protein
MKNHAADWLCYKACYRIVKVRPQGLRTQGEHWNLGDRLEERLESLLACYKCAGDLKTKINDPSNLIRLRHLIQKNYHQRRNIVY